MSVCGVLFAAGSSLSRSDDTGGDTGAGASAMLEGVEYADTRPIASLALTRKYHVPVAKDEFVVYELLETSVEATPLVKEASCDSSTVYGVGAKPDPLSDAGAHVQVGERSVDGVIGAGVPGVVGAFTSTVNAIALPCAITNDDEAP